MRPLGFERDSLMGRPELRHSRTLRLSPCTPRVVRSCAVLAVRSEFTGPSWRSPAVPGAHVHVDRTRRSWPGPPIGVPVATEQNPTMLLLTCGNSLRNTIAGRLPQSPSMQVRRISVGSSAIAAGTPSIDTSVLTGPGVRSSAVEARLVRSSPGRGVPLRYPCYATESEAPLEDDVTGPRPDACRPSNASASRRRISRRPRLPHLRRLAAWPALSGTPGSAKTWPERDDPIALEVARIGVRSRSAVRAFVPAVSRPCLPDQATHGNDRVGEVEECVDDGIHSSRRLRIVVAEQVVSAIAS